MNRIDNYKDNIIVSYNGKIIDYGDRTTIDETKNAPLVDFRKKPGVKYTTIMIDPDAPSPKNPTKRFYLHWLIVNQSLDSKGDIVNKYTGPNPPMGTHRYYICIFEQEHNIVISEQIREKFQADEFIKKNIKKKDDNPNDNNPDAIYCTKFTVKAPKDADKDKNF